MFLFQIKSVGEFILIFIKDGNREGFLELPMEFLDQLKKPRPPGSTEWPDLDIDKVKEIYNKNKNGGSYKFYDWMHQHEYKYKEGDYVPMEKYDDMYYRIIGPTKAQWRILQEIQNSGKECDPCDLQKKLEEMAIPIAKAAPAKRGKVLA